VGLGKIHNPVQTSTVELAYSLIAMKKQASATKVKRDRQREGELLHITPV